MSAQSAHFCWLFAISRLLTRRMILLCLLVGACNDQVNPGPRDPESPPQLARAASPAPAIEGQPPSKGVDSATLRPPALDFRKVRIDPAAYEGSVQPCDVTYRDRTVSFEGRLREQHSAYPENATGRIDLQCASGDARVWVDLLLTDEASRVEPVFSLGKRIEVRVLAAFGGNLDRTVVEFQQEAGIGIAPPAPGPPAADGFNFSQLTHNGPGSPKDCQIDFVGQLQRISTRQRKRYEYRQTSVLRSSVRCLHDGGDSWLDAVFSEAAGEAALELVRGARVSFQILQVQGGYGGLPVAVPNSAFLDAPGAP